MVILHLGDFMDWKEVATGIVVVNNVGDGAQYIKDVEKFVEREVLSWVPHNDKPLKEDLNRKAMNTMYINNIRRNGLVDPNNPTTKELVEERLFNRFEKDFYEPLSRYTGEFKVPWTQKENYEILKYGEGNFFIDHVDDGLYMTRKVSMVYYFNDDYEGGEIIFPRFGVEIKPKANQLLLFPAAYIYNHNVNEVTSGTRYSMVNWTK